MLSEDPCLALNNDESYGEDAETSTAVAALVLRNAGMFRRSLHMEKCPGVLVPKHLKKELPGCLPCVSEQNHFYRPTLVRQHTLSRDRMAVSLKL